MLERENYWLDAENRGKVLIVLSFPESDDVNNRRKGDIKRTSK